MSSLISVESFTQFALRVFYTRGILFMPNHMMKSAALAELNTAANRMHSWTLHVETTDGQGDTITFNLILGR